MTERRRIVIWAVSDGRAGLENQVLGLAEAVQRKTPASIITKRIAVDQRAEKLPRALWGDPFERLTEESDRLQAPWPDLLIGCGRRTVPFTRALKQHCFTVQTQDPKAKPGDFGLVVPPAHDQLTGANVLPIQGSPNRLSKERLNLEAQLLSLSLPRDIQFKSPYAAVLIGGPSRDYRWNKEAEEKILSSIAAVIQRGHFVLATVSRRTPPSFAATLKNAFKPSKLWLWDGEPVGPVDNPYFGMLGMADRVLVTEESANMITEAAFTGMPVHLLPLPGGGPKWQRFHESLRSRGVLRPKADFSEEWTYPPLRETDRVAEEIVRKLVARGMIEAGL
jgi:mitochondrial fission protein ELM1